MFRVTVKDGANRIIANHAFMIEQAKHQFSIGAAIEGQLWRSHATEEFDKALDIHSSVFNEAGIMNTFKWKSMIRGEPTHHALGYWSKKGMNVRGDAIMWPKKGNTLTSIWEHVERLQMQGNKRQQCFKRIADAIAQTKHYINEWDVINELADEQDYFGNDIIADGDGILDSFVQIEWLDEMIPI